MSTSLPKDQLAPLVRQIQAKVRQIAPPRWPDRGLDEDLVQDAVVAVLRELPRFDPLRASLTTFVARVAESAIADTLRRRTADKRNPLRHPDHRNPACAAEDCGQPDAQLEQRDLVVDLEAALGQLPPDLEQLARQLREWTPREIADQHGTHRGTIYRRIARLRERWSDSSLQDYLDV